MYAFIACLAASVAGASWHADDKKTEEKRVQVGRQFSPLGTLLVRERAGKPWSLPALYDGLHAGDTLVTLPGARAVIELKEGDARVTLLGNLPDLSPGPLLESAVTLQAAKDVDVDLSLDRGRLLLDNRKEKGQLRAQFRFGAHQLTLSLEPGARIALERYGAWRPGVPFLKKPRQGHAPESEVVLLVLKGKLEAAFPGERHALEGGVAFHWNLQRGAHGPLPIKKIPDWLTPDKSARADTIHAAVEKVRRKLAEKKELTSVGPLLKEKDDLVRRVAVFAAGAVDEVDVVWTVLEEAKAASVRDAAVLQLRHWIGHDPERDLRLFKLLLKRDYAAGEAEIVMGLLHSFGERDLAQPETYDVLINYLGSERMALRELSHWHLRQIVPQGQKIGYDAAADAEQRAKAQAAWRALIPEGKVPPRDK